MITLIISLTHLKQKENKNSLLFFFFARFDIEDTMSTPIFIDDKWSNDALNKTRHMAMFC